MEYNIKSKDGVSAIEDTIALLDAMAIVEPMNEQILERTAYMLPNLEKFDQAETAHRRALK